MPQVVQAKCPHCQNVLRIPAEWVTKAMRCKHCHKTFQAKNQSASANANNVSAGAPPVVAKTKQPVAAAVAASAVAVAPKVAAPPKAPSSDPFGFAEADAPEPTPRIAKKRKRGSGLLLLVLMFFFLFFLGAAGAGFIVYKAMFSGGFGDLFANADGRNKVDAAPVHRDGRGDTGAGKDKDEGPPKDDRDGKPPAASDASKKDKKAAFFKELSKKDNKDGKKPPIFSNDPFPRRALLISVNNYLMFSTAHFGSAQEKGYPGSSTSALRDRLIKPPMHFHLSQVTELSDGIPSDVKAGPKPHSTQKSVLETTIRDFVDASREQDRVLVLFAGHGAHVEDKSYLVPIDGNLKDVGTLLPLKWVYDQLARCKAQQKVLILDVFRYSPGRGNELPSPGEGAEGTMPEGFDKDLVNPPSGVQVWCSCQKEQVSIELDNGSAFMQALCNSLQAGPDLGAGIANPTQPIPIENLVIKVNQRLKDLSAAEKRTQISRLTGKTGEVTMPPNKDEAIPPALTLKPPTAPGGEAAGLAQVNSILDEMKKLPPFRDTRAGDVTLLKAQNLPAFLARKLDGYKTDGYQTIADLEKRFKTDKTAFTKEFPLRAAYFEAIDALQTSGKISMREVLSSPVDPKAKARFLQEQAPLGMSIFELEKKTLDLVKKSGEQRDMETSKRWQANFDFAQARLQSRLIYLYEYNYTLGQIRADNLPDLVSGQNGWRVGITGAKINVPERAAKDLAKANVTLWKKIQEQYPDTPWALLAQRESMISLGLAWRPKSD